MNVQSSLKKLVWGLDLGTTTVAASVYVQNKLETVLIDGEESASSTVYIGYANPPPLKSPKDEITRLQVDPPTTILVGKSAVEFAKGKKENSLTNFKSLMGKNFNDRTVQELIKTLPYKIVKGKHGRTEIEVEGRRHSPEWVSSLLVNHAKKAVIEHMKAKGFVEVNLNEVVVGVPADFNNTQRTATENAVKLCGMIPQRLLAEPTAVSYTFLLANTSTDGCILVLDIGGGTTDISLQQFDADTGDMDVLNTAGDNNLGGQNFTTALLRLVLKKWGGNPDNLQPAELNAIAAEAETRKREFAKDECTSVRFECVIEGEQCQIDISRTEFEAGLKPILGRLKLPINKIKEENAEEWATLRFGILMGQSTLYSIVVKHLEEYAGLDMKNSVNRSTAVAHGCAAWASRMGHKEFFGNTECAKLPTPVDCTPHNVGFGEPSSKMVVVVPRRTQLPLAYAIAGETEFDQLPDGSYAETADIQIFEGSSTFTYENTLIGARQLRRRPIPSMGDNFDPRIRLEFTADANGRFLVVATAVATGDRIDIHCGGVEEKEGEEEGEDELKIVQVLASRNAGNDNAIARVRGYNNTWLRKSIPPAAEADDSRFNTSILYNMTMERADGLRKEAMRREESGEIESAMKYYRRAAKAYNTLPSDLYTEGVSEKQEKAIERMLAMSKRLDAGVKKVLSETSLQIPQGELGWDYRRVFKLLMEDEGLEVVIYTDSYVNSFAKFLQLNMLINQLFAEVKTFKRFILITMSNHRRYVGSRFCEMKLSFTGLHDDTRPRGVELEVVYDDRSLDTTIETNTAYKVMLDTGGINVYSNPPVKALAAGAGDYRNLLTRSQLLTFFKLPNNAVFNSTMSHVECLRDSGSESPDRRGCISPVRKRRRYGDTSPFRRGEYGSRPATVDGRAASFTRASSSRGARFGNRGQPTASSGVQWKGGENSSQFKASGGEENLPSRRDEHCGSQHRSRRGAINARPPSPPPRRPHGVKVKDEVEYDSETGTVIGMAFPSKKGGLNNEENLDDVDDEDGSTENEDEEEFE